MPLRVPTVLVAMRLQQIVEELHVELVVLHDQDGLGHSPPLCAIPEPLTARCVQPSPSARALGHNRVQTLVRDFVTERQTPTDERPRRSSLRRRAETLAVQALGFIAAERRAARARFSP